MAFAGNLIRRRTVVVPDAPHLVGSDGEYFRDALGRVTRYLEYGAGGSTVLAARQGISTVCIESDKRFAGAVKAKIEPLEHRVVVHYADIGPTGRWGRPLKLLATPRSRRRYPDYVFAPDHYASDAFFDLVLIDGRFRIACALYAIRRVAQARTPCTICFDDYRLRHQYRAVEVFCKPARLGENMAVFCPDRTGIRRLPTEQDIRAGCRSTM